MKPDFSSRKSKSFFIALGKKVAHFSSSPRVSPSSLSILQARSYLQSINDQKPHSRFDQQCSSKALDICPNSEEAFFIYISMPSHASCHLSENKHTFAVKKEEKLCLFKTDKQRCERRDLGRGKRMRDRHL